MSRREPGNSRRISQGATLRPPMRCAARRGRCRCTVWRPRRRRSRRVARAAGDPRADAGTRRRPGDTGRCPAAALPLGGHHDDRPRDRGDRPAGSDARRPPASSGRGGGGPAARPRPARPSAPARRPARSAAAGGSPRSPRIPPLCRCPIPVEMGHLHMDGIRGRLGCAQMGLGVLRGASRRRRPRAAPPPSPSRPRTASAG